MESLDYRSNTEFQSYTFNFFSYVLYMFTKIKVPKKQNFIFEF